MQHRSDSKNELKSHAEHIAELKMWWKKGKTGRQCKKIVFLLDKDSHERFSRLKAKIPAFDEDEILAATLKCLEQKVDRIIMKQGAKKNRALKDMGPQLKMTKVIGHYPEQKPSQKRATFQIK